MIVIDASALLAIVFDEPERPRFLAVLNRANRCLVSAVSVVEVKIVIHGRRGERAVILTDDLLRLPLFEIVAPDTDEVAAAHSAFVAFGAGSGHPAALNFGELFSYALAKVRDLPLLYKGEGFAETDIQSALR